MKLGPTMACVALALAGCLPDGGGRDGDGELPDDAAPLCEVPAACPAGTSFYWTWVTDDGGLKNQSPERPSPDHWLSHIACLTSEDDSGSAVQSFLLEGYYLIEGGATLFEDDAAPGGPLVTIQNGAVFNGEAGDSISCAPGQERAYERRFYNSSGQLTRTEEWPENNPDGYSPPSI